MTIKPLHLATTTVAMAVGLFSCTSLFEGLDGTDIQPLPDPVVHEDVEIETPDPKPVPDHKPALGFEIGESARTDIVAWADAADLVCEVEAMGRRVSCTGPRGEVDARFDRHGTLVGMDVRRWLEPEVAEARHDATVRTLEERVGPTTSEVRSDRFVRAAYERSERHFGYRGYEATVTATHFGHRGVLIRERYRATR
jgi:hypothetical protein